MNAASDGHSSESPPSPRAAARQLDGEIAALREELGSLVGELDRRRHEALDVKLQARRHAGGLTVSGAALVAAASGLRWLMSRRHQPMVSKAGKVGEALSRILQRPARVAAEPRASTRILTAAATAALTNAAVAITGKKLLRLGLQRFWDRGGPRTPLPFSGLADRGLAKVISLAARSESRAR